MNIENMILNELQELYIKKQKELEELYNSNEFIWLKNNEYLEVKYYNYLVKYKIYESKKKSFKIKEETLLKKLYTIEQEILKREDIYQNILIKKI